MRTHLRFAVCLVAALAAAPADAQVPATEEQVDGITVVGTGEVRVKPNLVEIELQNTGTAELSGDAIVKYRDNKRRMLQAFEGLKLKELTVEERGLSLAGGGNAAELEQAFRHGGTAPAAKPQIQVARSLRLSLRGVREMSEESMMETLGKIFDVASDSGISLAPNPEVQAVAQRWGRALSGATPSFVVDDLVDLREQAYRKAFEDARARAERLASLTGVKLGGVVGASEVQVAGDDPAVLPQPYYYYYGYPTPTAGGDAPGSRVTSASFAEIPIRVRLKVRFAIDKTGTETAKK